MEITLCVTILAALLSCLFGVAHAEDAKPVTANVIRGYLLDNSPWVDPQKTVDTIKFGDGDKAIHKAAVCWYPSIENLRKARDMGCDLVVTHEPTFWEHAAPEQQWRGKKPGIAKCEVLEGSGMVVLRAHDTWDQWPEVGIRDSWAAFLGLGPCIHTNKSHRYHGVYEVRSQSLRMLAQELANRVKPLGEDSVQAMGDPNRTIEKVAIGVGCVTPDEECIDAGADAIICCYDGASYWSTRERLHESGAAILTLEHGTTEMPGIENLCKHLAERFPSVKFQYIAEHPRTWTVKGL